MGDKEIVVYTMTGCQHCAGVKAYLAERGIEFTERNVLEDDEAMADFQELGFRGTPVTLVGEEAIVGFDRARFDELLGAGADPGAGGS
jgi:glutaredoxin-like protein NrdH